MTDPSAFALIGAEHHHDHRLSHHGNLASWSCFRSRVAGGTSLDFDLDSHSCRPRPRGLAGLPTSPAVAAGAGSGSGRGCECAFSSVLEVLTIVVGPVQSTLRLLSHYALDASLWSGWGWGDVDSRYAKHCDGGVLEEMRLELLGRVGGPRSVVRVGRRYE